MKLNKLLIFLILPLFLICGCQKNGGNSKNVEKDEYDRLDYGMQYKKVCTIIGSEGQKIVNSSQDENDKNYTVMYSFEKEGGGYVYITFKDDKLISKSQF